MSYWNVKSREVILWTMLDQRLSQDMMIPKRLMELAEQYGVMITSTHYSIIAWGRTAAAYACATQAMQTIGGCA